jgi:hypothetical protein
MRNSRLVVGLVAVACAAALPAAASAHTGQPGKSRHGAKAANGHPGKGNDANRTTVRLAPLSGQTARGFAELKQRTGALSVALVVSHLTPGAFYAAHVHNGTCATPGAVALTLPDIYADEDGVAKLVTTLPTGPADNYIASGFSVDVHAGASNVATPAISCGDVVVKAAKAHSKARSKAWLKGTTASGWAKAVQKGSDVTVRVSLRGVTPGVHALHLRVGTCAAPGALAVSLGDVTADPDGNVHAKVTATSSAAVVGSGYSLDVQAGATGTPESVVACGDQIPTGKHGHQ